MPEAEADLNSTIARSQEANGKIIRTETMLPGTILKDLRDLATTLAIGNSAWTRLEINQLRNCTVVPQTKSKKRGTTGSIREIKETDHLKSNSLTDEP